MKLLRLTLIPAVLFLASSFFCQSTSSTAAGVKQRQPGIVVYRVGKGSEAEKNGLKEGDILLRWTRGDANGSFESPFELSYIEVEQRPRGTVTITGSRGDEQHVWKMGDDIWGVFARPNLSGDLLVTFREADDLGKSGKLPEAVAPPENGSPKQQ